MDKFDDWKRYIDTDMDLRTALGLHTIVQLCALYEERKGVIDGLALVSHLLNEVTRVVTQEGALTLDEVVQALGFPGGIEQAEKLSAELDLPVSEMEDILKVWDREEELGNPKRS